MRKALDAVYDLAGYAAAACVFAIFFVMIATTLMRYTGISTGGSDDIVSWLTAAAAFLGMAHTFKRGDFVRMTLVLEQLGARARRAMELLVLLVGSACCLYLAFWSARSTWQSWQFNDMANGLIAIPLWIPQMSFVVGAALLSIAVVDEFVFVLRGNRPRYVTAVEERHARGDFAEDV